MARYQRSPYSHLLVALMIVFVSVFALPRANAASTSGITYQGRILKPDGHPLNGQHVQFRMQLRSPDSGSCLMYEEVQQLDMRDSSGLFGITINDGSGTRTDSSGYNLDQIFANRGSFSFASSDCAAGNSYAPNPSDGRVIQVYFKDETMSAWEPMPPQALNFVPLAIESKQIAGFTASNLLRFAESDGTLVNTSPLNNAQYTELLALVNGTSNVYEKAGKLAGGTLPTLAAGQVLGWSGTAWTAVDPSSASASVLKDPDGGPNKITFQADPTIAANYTITWPAVVGSANQVLVNDGTGKLSWGAPPAATQWTTSGSNIYYNTGNVGVGNASPSFKLDVSGVGTGTYIMRAASTAGAGYIAAEAPIGNSTGLLMRRPGAGGTRWTVVTGGQAESGSNAGSDFEISSLDDSGGALGTPFFIKRSTGNVGIGTTSPASTLDVNGSLSVAGSTSLHGLTMNSSNITGAKSISVSNGSAASSAATISASGAGSTGLVLSASGGTALNISQGGATINGPVVLAPAALPSSPVAGNIAFDSANSNALKFYDGTTWKTVGTGNGNGDFMANGSVNMTGSFKAATGTAAAPGITFASDPDTGFVGGSNNMYVSIGGSNRGEFNSAGAINWYGYVMGSRMLGGAGSAQYPSLGFSGADNAGFYTPAANEIAVTTASTERMRIAANGNVGIGITNPAVKLHVNGDTSINGALWAQNLAAPNIPGFNTINSTGGTAGYWTRILNVTMSQQYQSYLGKLEITSGTTPQAAANATVAVRILQQGAMGTAPLVSLELDTSNSIVKLTDIVAVTTTNSASQTVVGLYLRMNTDYDTFNWAPVTYSGWNDSISYTATPLAAALPAGTQTAANPGQTRWYSGSVANSIAYTAGNVGIGTTTSNHALEVVSANNTTYGSSSGSYTEPSYGSGAATGGKLWVENTSTTNNTGAYVMLVSHQATIGQKAYVGAISTNAGNGYAPHIVFGQKTGPSDYAERMRIHYDGTVGIGTTSPQALLDVAGAIRVGSSTTCGAPTAGSIRYLTGNLEYCNGTGWQTLGVAGSGITALTGDVTASGTGSVAATIANQAVTSAKIANNTIVSQNIADGGISLNKLENIATAKLLGRSTAAAGPVEQISIGTGLSLSGGILTASGTDSFAALPCANGYLPYKSAGAWTCAEGTAAGTVDAVVKRDSAGAFVASGATLTSALKLKDGTTGGEISIAAPTGFTNYSLTLPTTAGTNGQVLTTNGSGVLSWGAGGAASQWTTSGSNINYVVANGGVSVGTTDPYAGLTSNSNAGYFAVAGSGASSASSYGNVSLANNRATPSATDYLGALNFTSMGAPATYKLGAQIAAQNEGAGGANGFGTSLQFSIKPNNAAAVEAMRIDSSGRVGIGITSPTSKLEVSGTGTVQAKIASTSTNNEAKLNIVSNEAAGTNASSLNIGATSNPSRYVYMNAFQDIPMSFMTQNTTRLRIGSGTDGGGVAIGSYASAGTTAPASGLIVSGNVGIGTASPTQKLEVHGADSDVHLNIQNNSATAARYPGVLVQNYSGGFGGAPTVTGIQYRGNSGSPAPVQSGDSLLTVSGNGATNSTYGTGTGALIQMQAAETFSPTALGTNVSISTAPVGSATLATRLMILNNGRVGVGTTSPGGTLDVQGGTQSALNTGGDPIGFTAQNANGNGVGGSINLTPGSGNWGNGTVVVNQNGSLPVFRIGRGNTDTYTSSGTNFLPNTALTYFEQGWNNDGNAALIALRTHNTAAADQYAYFGAIAESGSTTYGSTLVWGQRTLVGGGYAERMRMSPNGYVGIGTTAPSELLEVNGNVKATAFISTSDARLKKNIVKTPGLDFIRQLTGVQWQWKNNNQTDAGVIAQDLERVMPYAVVTDAKSGYKAVKYNALVAPLIESTKELYGMCSANAEKLGKQERSIASLQEENARLNETVEQLKDENAAMKRDLDLIKKKLGL